MAQDKKAEAWALFADRLSPTARRAIEAETSRVVVDNVEFVAEVDSAYQDFLSTLSSDAQQCIHRASETGPPVDPAESQIAFYLVEGEDGELQQVRKFKTLEGMARRIGDLDGQDVAVAAFFGGFMQVTKGPQRYLLTMDGKTAATIPVVEGLPVRFMDADFLPEDLEIQSDGYLGPKELSEVPMNREVEVVVEDEEDEG